MIEVLLLAVALSMDAFAVSLGLGAKHGGRVLPLAIRAGSFFGLFQALMPLIGFYAGAGMLRYIEHVDHWFAFILLALIGGKMIYESLSRKGGGQDLAMLTNRAMLVLAIATSIDSLAVGITLSIFDLAPLVSILIIGVTTFLFSFAGIYIGHATGTVLKSKAELLGGFILIAIGIRILIEHMALL